METREQRLLRPLLDFFSKESNFQTFVDVVVLKTKNIPLRLLEWFVTNYAKKNDVSYDIKRPSGRIEHFGVYRSYRAQLKGSKKKEFDPCCRGQTITLEYESPNDHITTLFETATCQLNFFKWAIENLVLNYVETHYDVIYHDMRDNSKKTTTKSIDDIHKKNELSSSIYQQFHIGHQNVTIQLTKFKV